MYKLKGAAPSGGPRPDPLVRAALTIRDTSFIVKENICYE